MSIISEELYLFSEELQTVLSPTVLQELPNRVGFVQRLSKYQANELLALCTWLSQEVTSTFSYPIMYPLTCFIRCINES